MALGASEGAKTQRLSIIALICFLLIGMNLFRMQIVKGGYYRSLSEKNRIRVIYWEAPRGKILDRNGALIATSRLSYNCSVFSREAKKRMNESLEAVAGVLGVDPDDLKKSVTKKKPGAFNTVLVAEDITQTQAIAIEERLDSLPGFIIETRPVREYPYAEATAHLTGYIGPMAGDESEELEAYGYRQSDWLGREGLEKTYEGYLRGFSGGLQIEIDNRGKFLRALGVKEPKEGKDVHLTVDARLQSLVQGLLEGRRGAVIVMDLKDGALLSLNNSPSYNPNLFSSKKGRKDVGKYLKGEGSPMVNRSIHGKFPPGSIFKIATALAALDRSKVSKSTSFDCGGFSLIGGKIFRCWKEGGHGTQSMTAAFAHSCDVYFYNIGLLAGPDMIFQKAVALGMSRLTGIDLPGEKPGFVPTREWKRKMRHQGWFDGDTANFSIGQGFLQVTPIQALVMIGAAATEGRILKPHLAYRIADTRIAEKRSSTADIPIKNWRLVKEGLHEAVNSETGTGRLSRVPGLTVSGKTGTAESGQKETHAWFVGFAPEEDPKIAMVVFLENGGHGGVEAATLAGQVFKWLRTAQYL